MIFVVTGKLGGGKTLISVGRIRDALWAGKRVATNLDLNVEELVGGRVPIDLIRLPDFPKSADLRELGKGNDTTDESKNGVIVLDEAGIYLGSRSWNDADRHAVVSWMRHTRKLGWDVYLITQDISDLDKMVRMALAEHLVVCRRLDRIRVPFAGALMQMIGLKGTMPHVHVATVKYGLSDQAPIVYRWWYRGKDLFPAYDTRQIFSPENDGASCYLDVKRYPWLKPRFTWRHNLAASIRGSGAKAWRVRLADSIDLKEGPDGRWLDFLTSPATRHPRARESCSTDLYAAFLRTLEGTGALVNERARHLGPLGAIGGEVAEPALHQA